MRQLILPAWELTIQQYFRLKTTKFYASNDGETEIFPSYRIEGFSQRVFCPSEAWDFCRFDKDMGHFFVITRQMERSGKVAPYLLPENLAEYLPQFRKFFREHPELQTKEAISL